MTAAARLLERLDGVRSVGDSRWTARCPAHEDRAPSLSIREADDGRVLAHCFAGCAAADVVAAVGLSLADLFDGPASEHRSGKPSHWHAARTALRTIHDEVLLVVIGAEDTAAGKALNEADRARLHLAVERIREAADVVG